MKPSDLVIIGCAGRGREVLGVVRAVNAAAPWERWRVIGFVDDQPAEVDLTRIDRLGLPYLGPISWLRDAAGDTNYIIGIGDPRLRAETGLRVAEYELPAARLIHPSATVGADVYLASGVVIFPGVRVSTNIDLGRHVHLKENATVGHDSVLADYVSVEALAAISGDCRLDRAASIGATAAVLAGRHIGEHATVVAGARVDRDVPPNVTVEGIPARITETRPELPTPRPSAMRHQMPEAGCARRPDLRVHPAEPPSQDESGVQGGNSVSS